jgi:hypothetical protein
MDDLQIESCEILNDVSFPIISTLGLGPTSIMFDEYWGTLKGLNWTGLNVVVLLVVGIVVIVVVVHIL